jgi:hypothetical protein
VVGMGFANVLTTRNSTGSFPKFNGVARAVASARAIKVTRTRVTAPGSNTLLAGSDNVTPIFPTGACVKLKVATAGSPSPAFAALSSSALTKTSCSGSYTRLKPIVFSVPRAWSVIFTSSVCPRVKFLFSALMTACVCALPVVSQTPDLNNSPAAQTHNKVNRVNGIR